MKSLDLGVPPARLAASDVQYELRAITLLFLGFGLIGLDRFIINPLFPVIQKDLNLNYQHLGLINGVLALGIGLAAIVSGRLTDRIGYKRVLVASTVVFSALVAGMGLVSGLVGLVALRALMGLAEGPNAPASIVATIRASNPGRIGMNVGLQQMAMPLFGSALAPLVAVGLIKVVPSWHWVFVAIALPGFVVAYLLARVLRAEEPAAPAAGRGGAPARPPWSDVLRNRTVQVNAVCASFLLACVMTMAAFMPSYLTDHVKLPLDDMAWVLSGTGFGGLIGMIVIPALSDRFGRKSVMVGALFIEVVMLAFVPAVGGHAGVLFLVLGAAVMMNSGAIALIGPLTNGAVPSGLAASALGFVLGVGELMGGALAPMVIGGLAEHVGISVIPLVAIAIVGASVLGVSLGVHERNEARVG